MVDHPLYRRIHLNRLSQKPGPPLFVQNEIIVGIIGDAIKRPLLKEMSNPFVKKGKNAHGSPGRSEGHYVDYGDVKERVDRTKGNDYAIGFTVQTHHPGVYHRLGLEVAGANMTQEQGSLIIGLLVLILLLLLPPDVLSTLFYFIVVVALVGLGLFVVGAVFYYGARALGAAGHRLMDISDAHPGFLRWLNKAADFVGRFMGRLVVFSFFAYLVSLVVALSFLSFTYFANH